MHTAIEIAIALFVFFAVLAALRGNWAGAFAAVVGAWSLACWRSSSATTVSATIGGRDCTMVENPIGLSR